MPTKPRAREKRRRELLRQRKRRGCSRKVWSRAKRLQAKYFRPHLFLVTGGKDPHRVYLGKQGFICDCRSGDTAYNQRCSHKQAVANLLNHHMAAEREG